MDEMNEIVCEFRKIRNDNNSIAMKNYMKNKFDFLGVRSTERKVLQKELFKNIDKNEPINKVWVLQLWSYNEREFQYLAIDYLINKKKLLLEQHIELLELLIINKPWWDTVDLIASHLVGELCANFPNLISEYIIKWAVHENLWLRRTAILYQLKYKEKTDTTILEYVIMENSNDNDFFIRKAIGWILREYSKTNKIWVKEFLNRVYLSNLSIKEASKYL